MAASHDEMKSKMTDFLMSGPDELKPECVLETVSTLMSEYESLQDRNAAVKAKVEGMKRSAEDLESCLAANDVMEKYKEYTRLKLKEQLLTVSAFVSELKRCQDTNRIPVIVNKIIECSPKFLSSNSKILELILATVATKKTDLLTDFHTKFESQLVRSEEFHQESISWGPFLHSARNWILAYTMVCILPSALRDQDQIMEVYQDSLDSAFTPLWGRFHFHLAAARESDSAEQILWTFDYSKSFLSLLTELCARVTHGPCQPAQGTEAADISPLLAVGRLHQFHMAGAEQIAEKGSKFMRAHVAECMSVSCWCGRFAISLLESSLDLDHYIRSMLDSHRREVLSTDTTPPACYQFLTISSVFCDREDTRRMWIDFDCSFFRGAILTAARASGGEQNSADELGLPVATTADRGIYGFYFNSLDSTLNGAGDTDKLRCFKCVYDSLHLLRLACQRYLYLPATMHDLFTCRVIEPILLSVLAFIFYRVRTYPGLQELHRSSRGKRGHVPVNPLEAAAVLDTCRYVQLTLQQASSFFPGFQVPLQSVPSRFERTWKHSMNWMCEVLKADPGRAPVGGDIVYCKLQPQEVMEKMYSICDKSADKISMCSILEDKQALSSLLSICDVSIAHVQALRTEIEGDLKNICVTQDSGK